MNTAWKYINTLYNISMGTVKLLKNTFIKVHHVAMLMRGTSLVNAFSFLGTI